MSLLRPLALLAPALLLAACAGMDKVAPPQARKLDPVQLNAGAAIGEAAAAGRAAQQAWPRQAWWQALNDPQLDRLLARALEGNPSLKASLARVRQAQALAGAAEAAGLPRVDGNAVIDRERYSAHSTVPAPLAGNYATKATVNITASYDLDLWGRNRDALAAALHEAQMAAAESQMVRLALQTAIVHSYIQLASAWAMQDAVAASLEQRRQILELTKRRRNAGLASDIDVATIETTLPAGRREREQAAEAVALLRNQLAALIGQGPGDGDTIARPVLTLDSGARGALLPSALPAELVARRPDLAAQRWRVEAAAKRIGVARADFYPNINLVAFAGFQALGFSRLLSAQSATRGVAPAIGLPIFEGGRLRAQLGSSNALYDMAVEQYNATLVQALAEVANAVTQARSADQQRQLAEQALASAGKAHALADRAFRAGMTDALSVLQARLTLLAEQQQMVQVQSKRLDSYAALMAALGGGIKQDLP
ncbi:fusaric acid resistance protein [Massilia sp. Root351]|jgi:NodT family efflux transporter outer membrane factor (OMF) lipoprotein|uniref:efflux transporter outer membrane subunit n=1 Tax=Massilia sp. Root351 TaxID=1736522 RepID=UPI00070B2D9E|nr:efflux transporter outer membrane subunit [Massilia sp. Root351]KQV78533.1 fusaric acid resistance protein [Massilia sp. Root351]